VLEEKSEIGESARIDDNVFWRYVVIGKEAGSLRY